MYSLRVEYSHVALTHFRHTSSNSADCVFIGEIPPYHYGTHYSSTMIVASYLIRLEPFTQHFLRVQVMVFT